MLQQLPTFYSHRESKKIQITSSKVTKKTHVHSDVTVGHLKQTNKKNAFIKVMTVIRSDGASTSACITPDAPGSMETLCACMRDGQTDRETDERE